MDHTHNTKVFVYTRVGGKKRRCPCVQCRLPFVKGEEIIGLPNPSGHHYKNCSPLLHVWFPLPLFTCWIARDLHRVKSTESKNKEKYGQQYVPRVFSPFHKMRSTLDLGDSPL